MARLDIGRMVADALSSGTGRGAFLVGYTRRDDD
jgi:hypothetical protein